MKRQDLFYPDILVEIGSYKFNSGIFVETYSDRNKPFDWGRVIFTSQYQPQIEVEENEAVTVSLGYDGQLEQVFTGNVVKGYNASHMDGILFRDKMMMLERTIINGTFLRCTPQELMAEALRLAGVTDYKLTDTVYASRSIVPVARKNVIQLIRQINAAWGISLQGNFIKGTFYWGVTPPQDAILEFVYAKNILSLGKGMGMWELVTVSMPSLQHSQKVSVIHPKITGIFEVEKVVFKTNDDGYIRTSIYFKE